RRRCEHATSAANSRLARVGLDDAAPSVIAGQRVSEVQVVAPRRAYVPNTKRITVISSFRLNSSISIEMTRHGVVEMNVIKLIYAKRAPRLAVDVSARPFGRIFGAAVVAAWAALLGAPVPFASAQPCPDVEVVFARGTGEPPGVGLVGQAFVDSL